MNKLIASIVFGLLILSSCQDSKHSPSKFKTIMIQASGEIETLPDMATFYINLECLDKSVKISKQCLVEKSNELNEKLISFGIAQKDITTTSVNMNKSYKWTNGGQVFEGYRSSTTVYVTVKDLDKLDAIYTELLENRNLELNGLNYTHSKLDSLKNEAYVKSLQNADLTASKLLANLPESKKEILKIGNVQISSSEADMRKDLQFRSFESEDALVAKNVNSVVISKGTLKINATLFVEFQIK